MYDKYTPKNIERFWGHVDKHSSQTFYNGTRCWEWSAFRRESGYGRVTIRGKGYYAHRVSYEITFGDISDGQLVLHHCDNPSCVNPTHLFLGTYQDNVDDMMKKGRNAIMLGEKSRYHKLTDKQIEEIRRRYSFWGKGGDTSETLAKEFGVSQPHILRIANHKSRT